MPLYESVFIARQDISAGQVDTLADDMEKLITDSGGSVARREYWGLRTLTYRMKKNRKGHFVMFNLDAPSDAIQEMERNLRLHEDVLRYMTIRLEELRSEPSPMVHATGPTGVGRTMRRHRMATTMIPTTAKPLQRQRPRRRRARKPLWKRQPKKRRTKNE